MDDRKIVNILKKIGRQKSKIWIVLILILRNQLKYVNEIPKTLEKKRKLYFGIKIGELKNSNL